jgi:hypothetical protein
MPRNPILVVTSVLVAVCASGEESKPQRPDLEVVLMIDGGFTPTPPHMFILKVNFSGEIEGGGDLNPGLPPPPERLSVSAHAELAALLKRERFFEQPSRNLGCAPDLGGRSIRAWRGTTQRGVSFCVDAPGLPVQDIQSVLRVWYGVLRVVANGRPVPVAERDKPFLEKKSPRRRTRG